MGGGCTRVRTGGGCTRVRTGGVGYPGEDGWGGGGCTWVMTGQSRRERWRWSWALVAG